jgi:glycerol-3-phosphate dehydrogenase (NAD(P)+)
MILEVRMATVTIVGAGLMGTATAWPLSDNRHKVRLVGTHLDAEIIKSCKERGFHPRLKRQLPDGVRPFFVEEIGQALEGTEIILSGVNSYGVRWIGKTLAPHVRPEHLLIAITKGLEATAEGDPMILPDVLASELPAAVRGRIRIAAVGGPCIAGELAGRRQSCVMFGCRDREAVERLAATFRTSYYHVWTTPDLVGLELCAALKNAYTLGVGLVQGILERAGGIDAADAHMHNLASAIFGQACTEIERMLQVVGGTRSLAYGLPGAGDLYVTCQGGRTVKMGRLLGLGHTNAEARRIMSGETLEGAAIVQVMGTVVPSLVSLGRVKNEDLPLMRMLIDILVHGRPVNLALDTFFGGLGRL